MTEWLCASRAARQQVGFIGFQMMVVLSSWVVCFHVIACLSENEDWWTSSFTQVWKTNSNSRELIFSGSGIFFLNQFGTSLEPVCHPTLTSSSVLCRNRSDVPQVWSADVSFSWFVVLSSESEGLFVTLELNQKLLKSLTSPRLHSHLHYARGEEKCAHLLSLVCTLLTLYMFRPSACAHWYRCLPLKKHCRQSFYKESIFSFAPIVWWWFTSVSVFSRENTTEAVSFRGCRYEAAHQHSLSAISIFFCLSTSLIEKKNAAKSSFFFWNKLQCCRAQTPAFLHRQSPAVTLFFFIPPPHVFFSRYSLLLYTRCNGAMCQSLISTCKVTVFFCQTT